MMRGYAETTGCRRQYLLGYFGEQLAHPCSNCDTCEAGTAEQQPARNDEFPPGRSVRHAEWGHGVVRLSAAAHDPGVNHDGAAEQHQ